MTLRTRFLLAVAATAACALLLGAAMLAGRNMPSTLAVASLYTPQPYRLAYSVVDVGRALTSRHHIAVDGLSGVNFQASPPLIAQGIRRDDTVEWSFGRLDAVHESITPALRLSTPVAAGLQIEDVQKFGAEVSVFSRVERSIYRAGTDDPRARFIVMAEPDFQSVTWSPDWSRLLISAIRSMTIAEGDGGGQIVIPPPGPVQMKAEWSHDSRHLLFAGVSSIVDGEIPIVDAETGDVVARLDGRTPAWCADRIVYTHGRDGTIEIRLTDAEFADAEVIYSREVLAGSRTLMATPLMPGSCEWFVVDTFSQDLMLVQRRTGATIHLGDGASRILSVTDSAVIYQVYADGSTEIRRIALDPAMEGYEVVMRPQRAGEYSVLLDGERGGLFFYEGVGALVYIDAATGAETLLESGVGEFVLLE